MSPSHPNASLEHIRPRLAKVLNVNKLFEPLSIADLKPLKNAPPDWNAGNGNSLVLVLQGASPESIKELFQYLAVKNWAGIPVAPEQHAKINGKDRGLKKEKIKAYLFSQQKLPNPSADPFIDAKDDFLKLVNGVIEHHLDDEDFRPGCLSKLLFLCDMQLHRKLKKRVNLSPANYIRKYRLRRSKAFLQNGSLSISQVSLMVGFRSLEYFSRSFKKEFGTSPSAFKKESGNSLRKG